MIKEGGVNMLPSFYYKHLKEYIIQIFLFVSKYVRKKAGYFFLLYL